MLGLLFVRRPTRGELKVIFFGAAALSFCLGGIAIALGAKAPADKFLLAHQAIVYGGAALVVGLVFLLFFWLLCRFSDKR